MLGLQIYDEVFEDSGGVCGRWMSSKVKQNNLGGFNMLGRKGYIWYPMFHKKIKISNLSEMDNLVKLTPPNK